MEKKRLFQILDEMNVADTTNKTTLVGVCPNLVSADYIAKMQGTKITMGVPGNMVLDIQTKNTIPILVLIDKNEYDKILKAGIGKIYFGWIGEYDENKPHYYVLNGPTFIIEFDNNGGPRNGANHIHAIWREKGNEYGEDVLKKHYQMEKH